MPTSSGGWRVGRDGRRIDVHSLRGSWHTWRPASPAAYFCLIDNTEDYVALMRDRASGALPDMGCALRLVELIQGMARGPVSILDVGCAAGHFRRTFERSGLPVSKYTGLEIDPAMVAAGREVWADSVA